MGNSSSESGNYIIVLVTVSSGEEAKRISDILLGRKVIACVNIVQDVTSLYWWKGKLEQSKELLLLMKSRGELLDEIVQLVKENHSYEVPEIVAVPIVGGNADYLRWIEESVEIHHKE
jgi:periplasmic divalent cation tolerance protein